MALSKHLEMADTNSCLNNAADDEPVFVLRAKDDTAIPTVVDWIRWRIVYGKNYPADCQLTEAFAWLAAAADWRRKNGKR